MISRRIQGIRSVLVVVVALLAALIAVAPPAHAQDRPTYERVTAFLETDAAREQAAAFLNSVVHDPYFNSRFGNDPVVAASITFPKIARIHYVHPASPDPTGQLADIGDFEWKASVAVDGTVRGLAGVGESDGQLAVAGYDEADDRGESELYYLPDDPGATLICDSWRHEMYMVSGGIMSPANDAARARLPEPLPLAEAAAKVSDGREPGEGVTADDPSGLYRAYRIAGVALLAALVVAGAVGVARYHGTNGRP